MLAVIARTTVGPSGMSAAIDPFATLGPAIRRAQSSPDQRRDIDLAAQPPALHDQPSLPIRSREMFDLKRRSSGPLWAECLVQLQDVDEALSGHQHLHHMPPNVRGIGIIHPPPFRNMLDFLAGTIKKTESKRCDRVEIHSHR